MDENESDAEIGARRNEIEAARKAAMEKAEEMTYVLPEDA